MLRATAACTFSTSQFPKVVRSWCVLYILTWKRASRRNGLHFFDIATSKSAPKLRCFVHFDLEMCFAQQRRAIFHLSFGQLGSAPAALASLLFDPPEPQMIGKNTVFRDFFTFFAHLDLLSSETFSSLIFSLLLFSLLLFSLLLFSSRFFCSTSAFHLSLCRKFDF